MDRTISSEQLKSLLAGGKHLTLLDVRRRSAYEADNAILPGAAWRDPEEVAQWGPALPKDGEIVVYCIHGHAVSNSVIDHLHQSGLRARYLEGGIEAWKEEGGATVSK